MRASDKRNTGRRKATVCGPSAATKGAATHASRGEPYGWPQRVLPWPRWRAMRPTIAVSPSTGVFSASIQNGPRTRTPARTARGIAWAAFMLWASRFRSLLGRRAVARIRVAHRAMVGEETEARDQGQDE